MTNELITKAKECKSAEELLALAKENSIEMTVEEAESQFAQFHSEGELSDDELDSAAGGGSCGKEKDYLEENETVVSCGGPKCKTAGCKAITFTVSERSGDSIAQLICCNGHSFTPVVSRMGAAAALLASAVNGEYYKRV